VSASVYRDPLHKSRTFLTGIGLQHIPSAPIHSRPTNGRESIQLYRQLEGGWFLDAIKGYPESKRLVRAIKSNQLRIVSDSSYKNGHSTAACVPPKNQKHYLRPHRHTGLLQSRIWRIVLRYHNGPSASELTNYTKTSMHQKQSFIGSEASKLDPPPSARYTGKVSKTLCLHYTLANFAGWLNTLPKSAESATL
jgi:hypothetical protein